MNSKDIMKFFKLIKLNYENFCFGIGEDEYKQKCLYWAELLHDIDIVLATKALRKHVETESKPPVISDIRRLSTDISTIDKMSGLEAYKIYFKYINLYSEKKDYTRLNIDYPDIYHIARLIGHKTLLIGDAEYIKPNFVKIFDKYQEELMKDKSMSDKLKREIASMQNEVLCYNKKMISEGSY